jgi:hypothetical protein
MNDTPPPASAGDHPARGLLQRQMEMAWQLANYHLDGLTTAECMWRPAARGLHVQRRPDGTWRADWPEHEGYGLGPSSIAWMTWHMLFWWSMALDHNFGDARLAREDVHWPGDADLLRGRIAALKEQWATALGRTRDAELASCRQVRWPFTGRPLADLFAWANTELTKSAAEIGYARFLHAAAHPQAD